MAYCIRCGVKLEEGSKACPLCKTPVHLPEGMEEQKQQPLFAQNLPSKGMGGVNKTRKGVIELIVSLLVISELTVFLSMWLSGNGSQSFIPLFSIAMASLSLILAFSVKPAYTVQASIQCLLVAVYLFGLDAADLKISWSLIASPAVGVGWLYFVYPFSRRAAQKPKTAAGVCLAGSLAYLALINLVLEHSLTWFIPVTLPVIATLLVLLGLFGLWFSKRKNKRIPLADVVLAALVVLFGTITSLDFFLSGYQLGVFTLRWSRGLLGASFVILVFLVSVSVSRRVRRYFTSHNRHT
ncbi:MAG: hypothetical protein VB088_01605 [Sphaerochaeta sp.]|jgi:hypothetical protein|nr:hypothetical protein [Sphaerochaeta sp.]